MSGVEDPSPSPAYCWDAGVGSPLQLFPSQREVRGALEERGGPRRPLSGTAFFAAQMKRGLGRWEGAECRDPGLAKQPRKPDLSLQRETRGRGQRGSDYHVVPVPLLGALTPPWHCRAVPGLQRLWPSACSCLYWGYVLRALWGQRQGQGRLRLRPLPQASSSILPSVPQVGDIPGRAGCSWFLAISSSPCLQPPHPAATAQPPWAGALLLCLDFLIPPPSQSNMAPSSDLEPVGHPLWSLSHLKPQPQICSADLSRLVPVPGAPNLLFYLNRHHPFPGEITKAQRGSVSILRPTAGKGQKWAGCQAGSD